MLLAIHGQVQLVTPLHLWVITHGNQISVLLVTFLMLDMCAQRKTVRVPALLKLRMLVVGACANTKLVRIGTMMQMQNVQAVITRFALVLIVADSLLHAILMTKLPKLSPIRVTTAQLKTES
jgi:hypothetical protein